MEFEVRQGPGPGCGLGGCFSAVLSVGLTCGIGSLVFGLLVAIPKGGSDEVVAAMARCPAVAAAMGTPIAVRRLSMGCGEEESGGGSGDASWTLSVSGPKSGGSVSYRASYLGNQPWEVESAVVTLDDGRTVTAVPCEGGAAPSPGRPLSPPASPPRPDHGDDRGKGGKRR